MALVAVIVAGVAHAGPPGADDSNPESRPIKAYFNLDLPGKSPFTPIVLQATKSTAIVARVFFASGRRDIQVLEKTGGHWHYLGRNGGTITGADGSFLKGAGRGPDGRLWVLAGYTPPSNPQRGFKDFLYLFDGTEWVQRGPREGEATGFSSDAGLHFLGPKPVHAFYSDTWRCITLEGDRWVSLPAEELLLSTRGEAWGNGEAWFIRRRIEGNRSSLDVYHLKGPRREDIVKPTKLETWEGTVECFDLAAAPDGTIVLFGTVGDLNDKAPRFARLYRPRKDGSFEARTIPWLPGPRDTPDCLGWSPTGPLHAARLVHPGRLSVFRFEGNQWVACGEATQGMYWINGPELFFRDDGVPIVVWHDFLPK